MSYGLNGRKRGAVNSESWEIREFREVRDSANDIYP